MKYLVLIALVVLLFYFLYRRLRPYLKVVREFLNTIRHFQQQFTANRPKPQHQPAEKLVRCANCGTWVPAGRALTSATADVVYCSADCRSGKTRRVQEG